MKKLLLLLTMTSFIGDTLFGMEKDQAESVEQELALAMESLPKEIRKAIVACSLLSEVGAKFVYEPFKKITVDQTVYSLAFSPDGKAVLTGSSDNIALLWDVETGQKLQQFTGHTGPVLSVAFSADSKTILTGSSDKTARLWDVETGQELQQFIGHTNEVRSVALSPDGKTVLTGSKDTTARLWDVDTGKELQQFTGHTGITVNPRARGIGLVAFSQDGKVILTRLVNGIIRLWDIKGGTELSKDLIPLIFSTNVQNALAKLSDHHQKIQINEKLQEFTGNKTTFFTSSFSSIAFGSHGTRMALGFYSGSVYLFNLNFSLTAKQKEEALKIFLEKRLSDVIKGSFQEEAQ